MEIGDIGNFSVVVEPANDTLKLIVEIPGTVDTPYEGGNFLLEIKLKASYPLPRPKFRLITRIWHPNICSLTGCLEKVQCTAAMVLINTLLNLLALVESFKPDDPSLEREKEKIGEEIRLLSVNLRAMLPYPELGFPKEAIFARQDDEELKQVLLCLQALLTSPGFNDTVVARHDKEELKQVFLHLQALLASFETYGNHEGVIVDRQCKNMKHIVKHMQVLLACPESDDPQDVVVARLYEKDRDMFNLTARYWAQVYAGGRGSSNPDFENKVRSLVYRGAEQRKALTALSMCSWNLQMASNLLFESPLIESTHCENIDSICQDVVHCLSIFDSC